MNPAWLRLGLWIQLRVTAQNETFVLNWQNKRLASTCRGEGLHAPPPSDFFLHDRRNKNWHCYRSPVFLLDTRASPCVDLIPCICSSAAVPPFSVSRSPLFSKAITVLCCQPLLPAALPTFLWVEGFFNRNRSNLFSSSSASQSLDMGSGAPSSLGNFSYPPPGSDLHFNSNDKVAASWLTFVPNGTKCTLSVRYWPGANTSLTGTSRLCLGPSEIVNKNWLRVCNNWYFWPNCACKQYRDCSNGLRWNLLPWLNQSLL